MICVMKYIETLENKLKWYYVWRPDSGYLENVIEG